MDDGRMEALERELAEMRPAELPEELRGRLGAATAAEDESLTFGDRVFVLFGAMGSVAAVVIVGMIVWQLSVPAGGAPTAARMAAQQQQRAAEFQRLLASR